jgi:hypothetical protein
MNDYLGKIHLQAELLHRRVCDDHARALCGHTGKISVLLFFLYLI